VWRCDDGWETTRALFFLVPRSAWSIGRRMHCSILHHRCINLFVDPGEFLVILRLLGKIPLNLLVLHYLLLHIPPFTWLRFDADAIV
jgi:hypothetical protein